MDLAKDILPTGTSYQAGSSKYKGVAIADPNNSGGTLTWSGPFSVAGGARATLSYRVLANSVTSTATDYTDSATAMVGSTVIDTTLDTTDSAPAQATATVDTDFVADTTAPTITLTGKDGANVAITNAVTTTSTSATMTFSASETATFTCSIDGAAPSSCASPKSYSGLAAGSHTFWVYAKDAAGNIGSTSLTWTVKDTAKPEVATFDPKAIASNTSPLTYTLEFTKPITAGSLTTSDLTLVTTGSPGTWAISSVLGSGTTFLVSVTSASPGTSGTVAVRIAANSVTDAVDGTITGPSSNTTSGAVTMTNTLGMAITSANPASGATSTSTSATFAFGPTAGKYPPDQYMCKGPGEASYTECTSPITYSGLTDGAKSFAVYGNALDATGTVTATTSASPESSIWTVDATAPSVTLTSPAAAALLTDNTPTLSGACTTADGTVTISIYAGGAASGTPVQSVTATCTSSAWTVDASTLADGQYTARATQTDTAGNVGTSSARTFTIDATRPTVTVAPSTASTTTASADFTVTFSESVTGLASADFTIGGTSTSPAWSINSITGSGTSYTVNLTTGSAPSLGTLTLKIRAGTVTDAAGNTGPASDSAVATMDVVGTGDLINGAISANNGNTWSEPVSRGGPGRSLPVTKTSFTEVGGGTPSNRLYRRVAAWLSGTCGTFDAGTEIPLATTTDDTSSLGDGCFKYELRGTSSNSAKNSTVESNLVQVDLTDPALGSPSIAGGDNQLTRSSAPTIALGSKSDAASGLNGSDEKLTRASTTFADNTCGTFATYDAASEANISTGAPADSGLASGCYRYTHRVGDNAGNRTTRQATVRVDVNDPTGGAVTAAGGSEWTRAAKPSVGGSSYIDANSGVASNSLTRASATLTGSTCGTFGTEAAVTLTGGADDDSLTQDCYRYTRSATDNAGNAASATATVKIDQTDPTGGAVTANGGDATWTKDAKPSITRAGFTDANSGIDNATSSFTRGFSAFNGGGNCTGVTYAGATTVTIDGGGRDADAGTLGEGCYRYRSSASDNAGNAATQAATVFIDRTDPTGGSLTAAGGSEWTNSQTPSLAGNSYGDANSGVATSAFTRAQATLTGQSCGAFGGETAVTVASGADAATLGQDCYRYTRSATDNAGNATSTTTTVKIDRTDPTGGSVSLAGGSAWTRSQGPAVGGNAYTDANSGIDSANITRQRAPLTGQTCGTYGSATTVTLTGGNDSATLDQACYRYTRAASDVAGNAASTDSVVKIDRTDPTGGAVTANGGSARWTKDAKPGLTQGPFTDANSGVDNATQSLTRAFAAFNGSGNCTGVTYAGSDSVTIDGNGRDADTNALGEGCYRYRSSAADNVGNTTSDDATVFIDRTAPAGGSIATTTTSGAWAATPSPGLSGSAFTDANSGIDGSPTLTRIVRERADYVAGGNTCSSTWVVDDTTVAISGGHDATVLTEACYRYVREAADNAGNTAATAPATVHLDLTGPGGGALEVNGGTDVDSTEGTTTTLDVAAFSDALSGLAAGSESLTRRIAPWTGGGARPGRLAAADEFGSYGSAEPVTLFGNEDPAAVSPGRYLYEHTVTDVAGNVTHRTALIEIRPSGFAPSPPTPAPAPTPAPVPDAGPAPVADLQLTMIAPAMPVKPNMPFPARAILRNAGNVAADSVTFTTTAPGDVMVLTATIRTAARLEAQLGPRCVITGRKTVTCTIPALEAMHQQVIDMVMVTPTGGFRVTLDGDAGATNTDSVHAEASVPNDDEVIASVGVGVATPALGIRAVALRRTAASGSVVPVVVTTSLKGADVAQLVMSVPASRAATLARVPRGTDYLDGVAGALSAPGMSAGASRRTVMLFRVTGRPGTTMRIPVSVASPGARPRIARTRAITIVAARGVSVTG